MSTPVQQRSLVYDVLKETDHMALATTRAVAKMNKLEVKLDQQVAVLQRQSESFRVHYLEGQKAAAQQASKASHQQVLAQRPEGFARHSVVPRGLQVCFRQSCFAGHLRTAVLLGFEGAYFLASRYGICHSR
jgi:hypothetical protein